MLLTMRGGKKERRRQQQNISLQHALVLRVAHQASVTKTRLSTRNQSKTVPVSTHFYD